MPEISAVITTYNRRDVLARTLPTVLGQDVAAGDFEVIVVDDGSTDGTPDYLSGLRSQCALRVIGQLNRGAAAARNAGLRQATGRLVILLDDDLLCPPWLLRQHIEAHARRPGGVVYGATNTAKESACTLATELTRSSSARETERLDRRGTRPESDLALDPNCSLSMDLVRRIGGFEESFGNFAETKEFAIRLRAAGVPFRYITNAAVEEIYVKSSSRLAREDALAAGRNDLRLRRRHPHARPESALACMGNGGTARAALRRAAVTIPGVDAMLSAPLQLCEALSPIPIVRKTGVRLLRWRQSVNFFRGAVAEAGSWQALADEFGATVPCLMYHHVGPARPNTYPELTVTPERFAEHLRWMREWGYVAVTPSDWARWRTAGVPLPRRPVILTFDDAYADTATHAFPLLAQHGMRAAMFVVAGELGGSNRWDQKLGCGENPLMQEEQVRYWSANGIEVGAHTVTHADVTALGEEESRREIEDSHERLSDLIGQPVASFAYPWGLHDRRSERIVGSRFALAFTTREGLNTLATPPHLLRRTMVLPEDSRIDLYSRLRLGYSLRHRWRGRLARARNRWLAPTHPAAA